MLLLRRSTASWPQASFNRWRIFLSLTVIAVSFQADVAMAQFRYRKIVDSSTLIPAGSGGFTSFSEVSYDGQNIAFIGAGGSNQKGVYLWNGSVLSALADVGASVPNSGGTFTEFTDLSMENGHVAFVAQGSTKDGVYTTLGGAGLRKVADEGTLIPGDGVPFTQFTFSPDVALANGKVYFNAFGTDGFSVFQEGVYRDANGVLSRVVDRSIPIPDFTDNFIFFSSVDAAGDHVVFGGGRGSGGGNGFYTTLNAPSGQLRTALNPDTTVPGQTNPLSMYSPNDVRIDGKNIAFSTRGTGGSTGVYLEKAGQLEVVADVATTNPTIGLKFTSVGNSYALSGDNVAFTGSSGGPSAIYLKRANSLLPVIGANNALAGKDVSSLSLFGESLHGDRIAFRAGFADGTSGIYIAEPLDTVSGSQSMTIDSIFDASSNGSSVTGNGSRIDVTNRISSAIDRRAILEFDLSTVPANAELKTVELQFNASLLSSGTAEGPSLAVYGYAGDGTLSNNDRLRTDVFLGESPMIVSLSKVKFHLDADAVDQIRQGGSILGLVGMGSFNGNQLGLDSREMSLTNAPKLIVTYSLPSPADFNADGIVDGADLAVWKNGYGQRGVPRTAGDADGDSDVDGGDFLIWQREYRPAAGSSTAVPEPLLLPFMQASLLCSAVMRVRRAAVA